MSELPRPCLSHRGSTFFLGLAGRNRINRPLMSRFCGPEGGGGQGGTGVEVGRCAWKKDSSSLVTVVLPASSGHSRARRGQQQIDPLLLGLAGGIPATSAAMTYQLISDGHQPVGTIFWDDEAGLYEASVFFMPFYIGNFPTKTEAIVAVLKHSGCWSIWDATARAAAPPG